MEAFWASVPVHVLLGLVAAIPVILWDWRIALPGILLVQLGTSVLIGTVYGLTGPWPAVHFGVQVLACLILLLSILQTSNVQVRTSGEFSSRLFRMLILGIAALMVWRATEGFDLPRLEVATKVLFIWFAAVALITLGMTETALFGSIGLLMWLIPVQAFLSVLFPMPAVIADRSTFHRPEPGARRASPPQHHFGRQGLGLWPGILVLYFRKSTSEY